MAQNANSQQTPKKKSTLAGDSNAMEEQVRASISGPALSLLIHENSCSSKEQEGFLLGKRVRMENRTITDNDHITVKVEHTIKVDGVLACPQSASFYDQIGRVDKTRLKELLGDQISNVVAVFKFRRVPQLKLTLRESILLKQLGRILCESNPNLFLFCMLTNQSYVDDGATHIFSQMFIHYRNGAYPKVPMYINNLSGPQGVYKSPESHSESFKKILSSCTANSTEGYEFVKSVEEVLMNKIDEIRINHLNALEKEAHELEKRIDKLRSNLSAMYDSDGDDDYFGLLPKENGLITTLKAFSPTKVDKDCEPRHEIIESETDDSLTNLKGSEVGDTKEDNKSNPMNDDNK